MNIYNCFLIFWAENWQTFVLSVIGSVVSTGLVALFLVTIFRVPNFDLHLDYIHLKTTSKGVSLPVLDISIVNKKKWLGFDTEGVYFGLFIPASFMVGKKLCLVTTEGKKEWNVDIRGKDEFTIFNGKYLLYRGIIDLPVHPDSRTNFLRIKGSFVNGTKIKIYYYFETVYGRYPRSLKFGERIKRAESGKLPNSEIVIS